MRKGRGGISHKQRAATLILPFRVQQGGQHAVVVCCSLEERGCALRRAGSTTHRTQTLCAKSSTAAAESPRHGTCHR